MTSLKGKTALITGATRGIGHAIALRLAKAGVQLVITGKTEVENEKQKGTIYSVVEEIEALGGRALACKLDVRDENNIQAVVQEVEQTFGGLDILINNASAIFIAKTDETPMKRFDLMMSVNGRATFACTQACLPLLKKGNNPHVLNLSPPLNMDSKWFKGHCAYTMSKYAMSMCTLGMSAEFKSYGIAVNSLWPETTIATAAVAVNFPAPVLEASRKPEIVADAAYAILCRDAKTFTGQFCVDETILREEGIQDFDIYAVNPERRLQKDWFLD